MKKSALFIFFCTLVFAYPNCNMCHNGRTAPDIKSMSEKSIINKLMNMKKGKVNIRMAFIKKYSKHDIIKMVKQFKEQK